MSYQPKGYKVRPLSRNTIRNDAHQILDILRKNIKNFTGCAVPIVDVIETLCEKDVFEMNIVESKDMNGCAATLTPSINGVPILDIDEKIYEEACNDDNFARFTLAHELGHYFLHSNQQIPLERSHLPQNHKPFEDTEWQANTFAGELLIDSRILKGMKPDAQTVAQKFKVSIDVAKIQIKNL